MGTRTVPVEAVRALYGTMQEQKAYTGVVVTTSSFGPGPGRRDQRTQDSEELTVSAIGPPPRASRRKKLRIPASP